jgi:hypothetical protein
MGRALSLPDCGTVYTLRSDAFARGFRYSLMTILPPPIRRKMKDCLTPVPPLRGSTGANEERMGGSLERIAARSGEGADQASSDCFLDLFAKKRRTNG